MSHWVATLELRRAKPNANNDASSSVTNWRSSFSPFGGKFLIIQPNIARSIRVAFRYASTEPMALDIAKESKMARRSDGQLNALHPGAGRRAVTEQLALLISDAPAPEGLVIAQTCLILGYPSELTAGDFLTNEHRRVGAIHDASELRTGHSCSSGCSKATIKVKVGDSPAELARIRVWRSRFFRAEPEIRVRSIDVSMTERARQAAGDTAGLRLLDLCANADAPDLEELHEAGREPGSELWCEIEALRSSLALVGFVVRSRSPRGTTLILNLHALEELLKAGLMEISIKDEHCRREDVFGHTTALDHFQQFIAWIAAWIGEIERLAGQAKRLGLIVLRFAWRAKTAGAALLGLVCLVLRLVL